jgi:hypothetical protein
MRVRSGRIDELARLPKLRSFLCRVSLCFDPQVFDADQSLCFQPRVVEGFLQAWGSRQVPVAVATHPVLDGGDEIDPEGHQIPDLCARPQATVSSSTCECAFESIPPVRERAGSTG